MLRNGEFVYVCMLDCMYMYMHVIEMKKEGRSKQGQTNRKQGKAVQHTQSSHFSKEK